MEFAGNGTPENAPGLAVKGLKGSGGEIHRQLAGHIQILVENEFYFLVIPAGTLDHAGTGM